MTPLLPLADNVVSALRSVMSNDDLKRLMNELANEIDCRYWALINHADLRQIRERLVNLKDYPENVSYRLIQQCRYRRDPVIRACLFAGSAFLWSELPSIICLDCKDRISLDYGARAGLNEGITVPYVRLGECMGSCTFAGMRYPDRAPRYLGLAQMVGVFAFQTARRLMGNVSVAMKTPRLYPRMRDCIVLVGRGYSNKEIARALSISPRTVDGYLTEARCLFGAHDRTELVASAILSGVVDLYELKPRQSE